MKEGIEKLKGLLEDHEARISRLEKLIMSGVGQGDKKGTDRKKLAIKEFLLSKNPKRDVLKTLTIGYYLEKYEGMSCFTTKDIERGFRLAKEAPPNNINDKVNKNIAKGFMMEAEEKKDNKKAYVLTASGETFVENNFEKKRVE